MQGDIENLQCLLRDNPSFVALRTYREGLTPLHLAIRHGQVEAARLLISCGANPQEHSLPSHLRTGPASSCFGLFTRELIFESEQRGRTVEILHLLIEENECNELIDVDSGRYLRKWLHQTSHLGRDESSSCVQMIQRNTWPPYQSTSLQLRLKNALAAIDLYPHHFWELLGQNSFDEECIALANYKPHEHDPYLGRLNPLPILFANISCLLLLRDCHQRDEGCNDPSLVLEQCRDILRRYLSVGGDEVLLNSASECLISFVQIFLNENATAANLRQTWQYGTQMFAQELVDIGLDGLKITAVGAEAKRGLVGTELRQRIISAGFWCARQTLTIRLIGLQYGATSSDWVIWIADDRDQYSGVFWQDVETLLLTADTAEDDDEEEDQRYSMPGAWIDHSDSDSDPQDLTLYGFRRDFWMHWCQYSDQHSDEFRRTLQIFSSSRRKRRRAIRYFGIDVAKNTIDCEGQRFELRIWATLQHPSQ